MHCDLEDMTLSQGSVLEVLTIGQKDVVELDATRDIKLGCDSDVQLRCDNYVQLGCDRDLDASNDVQLRCDMTAVGNVKLRSA